MTGQRLILNDETVIENGSAGFSGGVLWLFVPLTMQAAAQTFLDPEKTAKIIFQYGEMQDEYEGYTDCTVLNKDVFGNNVNVCMRKGVEA